MSTEKLIRYGILGFKCVHYLWESNLTLRQRRVYNTTIQVPLELREIIPAGTFERAHLYGLDRNRFTMLSKLYKMVLETSAFWCFDGIRLIWKCAGFVVRTFGFQQNELIQSAACVFLMNTVYVLAQLPVVIYKNFVLEEKHGFNRQTLKFFIIDKLKGFVLLQAILMPISTGLVYIIKNGGNYFFLYLWLFATASIIFIMTIYPEFIAPWLDKYTPLPDGELKTRIEQLAATVGFPVYKIYVVEGSKRSAHSNAYFYGFYKNKRIVLFDTLLSDYTASISSSGEIKGCGNEDILAVLAHELGHWKLKHALKFMGLTQACLLLSSVGFGALFKYDASYHAFGFRKEKPALIGLVIVLLLVLSPYNALLSFCTTSLRRRFEFQADAFAKSLGKGVHLRHVLIKMHKDNLDFPVYDRLYSAWNHSHPPLIERLKALDKDD